MTPHDLGVGLSEPDELLPLNPATVAGGVDVVERQREAQPWEERTREVEAAGHDAEHQGRAAGHLSGNIQREGLYRTPYLVLTQD